MNIKISIGGQEITPEAVEVSGKKLYKNLVFYRKIGSTYHFKDATDREFILTFTKKDLKKLPDLKTGNILDLVLEDDIVPGSLHKDVIAKEARNLINE